MIPRDRRRGPKPFGNGALTATFSGPDGTNRQFGTVRKSAGATRGKIRRTRPGVMCRHLCRRTPKAISGNRRSVPN